MFVFMVRLVEQHSAHVFFFLLDDSGQSPHLIQAKLFPRNCYELICIYYILGNRNSSGSNKVLGTPLVRCSKLELSYGMCGVSLEHLEAFFIPYVPRDTRSTFYFF